MSAGRTIVIVGLILVGVGLLVILGERLGFRVGRLPGDIRISGRNSVFYFPLATCALLSVVLSLAIWLFNRR